MTLCCNRVRTYTLAEAAEALGVNFMTIRDMIRAGELKTQKLGLTDRVSERELNRAAKFLRPPKRQPEPKRATPEEVRAGANQYRANVRERVRANHVVSHDPRAA